MEFADDSLRTLRNAIFPVYAVPPSKWPGDVMIGGAWGEPNHPLSLRMRYEDDLLVEWPPRRIEIMSTGAEGLAHRAPSEGFLLWEHSYSAPIINFVHNIRHELLPERPVPGSERFNADMVDGKLVPRMVHLPSAGPRRLIDAIPFTDGYQMERVAFEDRPELRLYRVQMPEVEVVMLAWGWRDEALARFMPSAQSIRNKEDLYEEIERAQHAAWNKIRSRDE